MPNIALLDCHDTNYTPVVNITKPRKLDYCQKNNYDMLEYIFDDVGRFPTWGKVLGMQRHLPQYDFILFLDTDILVMNNDVQVENQIDDEHNIFIGFMPDFNTGKKTHLSTSAWIMRNTEWSMKFLSKWWNTTRYLDTRYPQHGVITPSTGGFGGIFHEQSAFSYLYDIDADCRKNTKVMPFCWFNQREANYRSGDFLIHFARQGDKVGRLKSFLRNHMPLL